ncbi:MAG: excalibur calcium-binding domain-containing protein [Proteobacteria bacterium]|nr:excalibur calcium-binding domain-containing protein [Pseudomonadota bacterium]
MGQQGPNVRWVVPLTGRLDGDGDGVACD